MFVSNAYNVAPPTAPVAGMRSWYRADVGAVDGSGNPCADGSALATWHDHSGNGNDLTNSAGGATFTASAVNGRPALTFDGSTSGLLGPAMSLTDFTIFAVFRSTGHGAGNYERVIDLKFSSGTWIGRYGLTDNVWAAGVMESSDPFGLHATITDGAWHLITSQRTGTTHALYADGTTAGTNTVSGAATTSHALRIGCSEPADAYNRLQGNIAEVIIYSSALSDADRAATERYLRRRYGI